MADQRRYAALFAKGEERRARILAVAQRMVSRNGGRGTTLGEIAQEAGVSSAGLLHHFASKEQLLNAVLDARDVDDLTNADLAADTIEQLEGVTDRFQRSPQLIGMFTVLLAENLDPGAPLHDRFLGRYRTDLDPAVKAVEIVAFLSGMETSWLLDPSIPVTAVFREYTGSLARQLAPNPPSGTPSARD